MLSRDDSLINLAMLPMLDTVDDDGGNGGGGDSSTSTDDALPSAAPEKISSTTCISSRGMNDNNTNHNNGEDYNISGIFSRDDSLINLLATVDTVCDGMGANIPRQQQQHQQQLEGDQDGWGGDMFGFIDFQNVG